MGEYDSAKRPLPYDLRNALVFSRTTEDDADCESPSSFVWPDDPDERTVIPFHLSLNEYNVLASAVDVGSDIAYGADALRVNSLWLRNMRCEVPIVMDIRQSPGDCKVFEKLVGGEWVPFADLNDCAVDGSDGADGASPEMRISGGYIQWRQDDDSPSWTNLVSLASLQGIQGIPGPIGPTGLTPEPIPSGGNLYPPPPATNDGMCNAAAYIVAQIRDLIVDVYTQLDTIEPADILASLLGQQGWSVSSLYSLIVDLEGSLENEVDVLAAYDAAAEDIKCKLYTSSLSQTDVLAWVDATYDAYPAMQSALKYSIQAAASDGRWALWVTIGALQTGATCTACEEDTPNIRLVVAGGYDAGTLQFVDNVGDDSRYIITKFDTGNYSTGYVVSVDNVPFFVTDIEILSGNYWNVGAGSLQSTLGIHDVSNFPCYLPATGFGTRFGIGGDQIRITVSRNPCVIWSLSFPGYDTCTIDVQNATTLTVTEGLRPGDATYWAEVKTRTGVGFRITAKSDDLTNLSGASYYNHLNVNVPGLPPIGAVVRGIVYRHTTQRTITLTGYNVGV